MTLDNFHDTHRSHFAYARSCLIPLATVCCGQRCIVHSIGASAVPIRAQRYLLLNRPYDGRNRMTVAPGREYVSLRFPRMSYPLSCGRSTCDCLLRSAPSALALSRTRSPGQKTSPDNTARPPFNLAPHSPTPRHGLVVPLIRRHRHLRHGTTPRHPAPRDVLSVPICKPPYACIGKPLERA